MLIRDILFLYNRKVLWTFYCIKGRSAMDRVRRKGIVPLMRSAAGEDA